MKDNYRTRKANLETLIRKKKAEIAKLVAQEKKSKDSWTKKFRPFVTAAENLATTKVHGSKKEERLQKIILGFRTNSRQLTQGRDSFRAQIKKAEAELNELSIQLAILSSEQATKAKATDEVINQIFNLNDSAVRASRERTDYVTRHVFPRLIGPDGKMNTQISFLSSDGLRRVTAMSNRITFVQGDMASVAKGLVERFFDRFREEAKMSDEVKPLYELTRQILSEKTQFKVGNDLYRFLGMDLDPDVFPELSEAQNLLKASIRVEKTSNYLRIYERKSMQDPWKMVPQS